MEKGTFTVKLLFAYDPDTKEIYEMKVLEINGEKEKRTPVQGREAIHVQSTEGDYLGAICTTIILTKSKNEPDPCAWVWNPLLRKWFWRCWNSDVPDFP